MLTVFLFLWQVSLSGNLPAAVVVARKCRRHWEIEITILGLFVSCDSTFPETRVIIEELMRVTVDDLVGIYICLV